MVPETNDKIYVLIRIGRIYNYFSSVFCIVPKKLLLLKTSKVRQSLEKSLPLCKGGRKIENKFFDQSLLHPVFF